MPVFFGTRHAAHTSTIVDGEYVCARCGFRGRIRARGEGSGVGISPYFLDEEGAARRAIDEAQKDAPDEARINIQIVPCPKCGQRQPWMTLGYWGCWLAIGALPLIAATPCLFFYIATEEYPATFWLIGAFAVLLAFGIIYTANRRWRSVHEEVSFEASSKERPSM